MGKKVSVLAPNELADWNIQHECLLFEIPEGCKIIFKLFHSKIVDGLIVRRIEENVSG